LTPTRTVARKEQEAPMFPSPAEIVRTLVRGRLTGTLRFGAGPELAVLHATDCAGAPMVLTHEDDAVALAARVAGLAGSAGAPTVVLRVDDVPPVPGAPSLGRARISGRLRRLAGDAATAAAIEFAESNPVADLLSVGREATIHRVDLDWARLELPRSTEDGEAFRSTVDVDVDDYIAADPDPLHEVERDLLLDLADHHAEQIEHQFRRALAAARLAWRSAPRAVRVDRYGFVVDIGAADAATADAGAARGRWVRLNFPRPVRDQHELAHLLHPALFHGHPTPDLVVRRAA
jgi:hypothetical protein